MRIVGRKSLGWMAVVVLFSGACSKKTPPPPPAPQPASQPAPRTNGNTSNDDEAARLAAAERARNRATMEERIHFAYDRSDLSEAAQATLRAKLPLLRADEAIRLRIEGHADERGSVEYNLALGLRRAQSAREFLVGFGLDGSRFQVESFGEDRPLDRGQSESAWAMNRRAEFVILAGSLLAR